MSGIQKVVIQADEWTSLKQFTNARIALGKTGISIPLKEQLKFKVAHAQAKDAVYSVLDAPVLLQQLSDANLPAIQVYSNAANRDIYLQRPDFGRSLHPDCKAILAQNARTPVDIAIVIADGLSAIAVNKNALTVTTLLAAQMKSSGYLLAPIVLAAQARVALADEIGELLKARLTIILIGERPGLSAYESMSAYITYNPRPGTTDESRNCVSNIKQDGLQPRAAAQKIMGLVNEAFRLQLTGVILKDEGGDLVGNGVGVE